MSSKVLTVSKAASEAASVFGEVNDRIDTAASYGASQMYAAIYAAVNGLFSGPRNSEPPYHDAIVAALNAINGISPTLDPTYPDAPDWDAIFSAAAFPQKVATGLMGGKTTKAAAQRGLVAAQNAAIDKTNAVQASNWFEKELAAAQERSKNFTKGKGGQGLKTGTLTTGTLTVTGLARRVASSYRRKNRRKKR